MAQQTCNQFEPTSNTSSATICKWCGQEKFLHTPKVGYMAQTAVEWLINELANTGLLVTKDVDNLIAYHKAKAMEKEQSNEIHKLKAIIEFYEQGCGIEGCKVIEPHVH